MIKTYLRQWIKNIQGTCVSYKPRFTKEDEPMSKCRLNIGGSVFIIDTEQGLEMFKVLNGATMERLDYDYVPKSDSKSGRSETLYYLKSSDEAVKLSSVSAEDYAMWKLYTASRENKHE